jgi:hypothetical protein
MRCWQGDKVVARRPSGKIIYQGKLTAPPKYVDDVAIVSAYGPRSTVDQFADRLPYQIRGGDAWQSLDADPAHYSVNELYSPTHKGNAIGVVLKQGEAFAISDRSGFYLWVDGYDIQRVSGTIRKKTVTQTANFSMRVRRASSLGTQTDVQTFVLSDAANPDGTTFAVTFDASADTAIIDWNATAANTPAVTRKYWVDDLRVGVITPADTFTTADVASDVADRCGYASVTSGSLNVLPLDWTGAATDLLDYIAALEDSTWLVLHDPSGRSWGKLHFRAWGHHVWHTRLDGMAEDNGLTVLPLYDAYATTWENARGMPQKLRSTAVGVGLTDPLPGKTFDYPEPAHIPDPQPDNALAAAINTRALQRLTKLRVQGSVKVNAVRPPGVPFDILPGDALRIGDFEPKIPAQRVAGVTYNRDGSVTCSLERDLHLDTLVRHVARKHHRHPGHRKRHHA